MADPDPEVCEVCGASPLVKVLHPVPIHFKGSGFYSTDYGRGGRKRETGDGEGVTKKDDKKDTAKTEKPEKKKAADSSS